ncbi:MAG: phosphoribosylglycinamide formyltransferase [Leptospiraceae bacterium]|nr:phosphoribosylglycinamide formyltransferase [Leptospiraceae bacterium]MDW7976780.1 phosphoribosylglycinamide formyltransferase [Leptospiraceae bacterium]
MYRLLALASGRGSNFLAILKAIESKEIPNAKMVGLITDRENTGAEQHARNYQIPVKVIPFKNYSQKEDFHRDLLEAAKSFEPDLILGAGFMRILSKEFVQTFENRIMNIHPSLLPSFPGLHAQRQAWEYGVKVSGCTVHFIDENVDTGPIILQKAVEIPEGATEKEIADLILQEEHKLYVKAIKLFCENKLEIRPSPNQKRKIVIIKS